MSQRTIDVDTLSALIDAAGKWASELSEWVIPMADSPDEAEYADELERTNAAVEAARRLYTEESEKSG